MKILNSENARNKPPVRLLRAAVIGIACVGLLLLPQASWAINYTCNQTVAIGSDWNGNYWSTNADGSGTLTGPPMPGNTYELLPKGTLAGTPTRMRTPAQYGVQTFPGDSLQVDVDSELALKGAGAIVTFPGPGSGQPGLILNGGGIVNFDDGKFWLDGIIEVRDQSYLFANSSGSTRDKSGLDIKGQLIGTNNLAMINAGLLGAVTISGNNNTFSGQWIVKSGLLLAAGNGSLGTNSITIDPNWTVPATNGAWTVGSGYNQAVVSIAYDLNSAGTLTIANGGQLVLYRNLCFSAVTINGTPLSAGTYTYAALVAAYPSNFVGGSGQITVQPYGTLPAWTPPTPPPAQEWFSADISGPAYAGSAVTNGDGSLDILGGGDDIWNNTSHFHYYYSWALGTSWDVSMKVNNFTGPDYWSKVELLVSPADPTVGPVGNDAFIAMMDCQPNLGGAVTAPDVNGVNIGGVDQFRTAKGGASDWLQVGNNPIPDYPVNWLRITRNGSAFNLYRSSDGHFWRLYLTIDTANSVTGGGGTKFSSAWPDLVTVGVAVTAHNNASVQLGDANISNLQGTWPPAVPPTVLVTSVPIASGVTNAYACEASLSFAATNNAFPTPALVPVLYQWYKGGSPIAGATTSVHTWLLDTNDNGAQYYCTATCSPPYNSLTVTSGTATIGVTPGVYYTNGLKSEMFTGATRTPVELGNVNPAAWVALEPGLDDPGGYGNYYANRVSGWFIAPTTDSYTFFVACDDDADLLLSTDATMSNKQLIAQETGWSGMDSWLDSGGSIVSQKRSDQWTNAAGATPYALGIPLTAGRPYYLELVHHQGTGGDNFGVTYQTATMMADTNWATTFTNGTPSLIQGTNGNLYFVTRPPTTLAWVFQPTNTTATLGLAGTFYALAASDGELSLKYQWYRDGTPIAGATGSSYSIALVASGDSGAGFTVVATTAENELSITSSPPAILNVAAPVLETGWAKMEYWYTPDPGIASFRVAQTNSSGITTNYGLNTTYSTSANYTIFEPIFEGNSKGSAPSLYTSRLSTYFYPPTTGNYVFFVNSDDPGDLYVSTDSTPGNAVMVAQETGWSGSWNWVSVGGGGTMSTKRSDQWVAPDGTTPWANGIPMTAGQPYYVAIIHQDTGGGNNCEATFKLTTDADPADGTYSRMQGSLIKTYVPRCFSMAFSQQPVNVTAPFNGTATLTAQGATDSRSAIGDETNPSLQWTNSYVLYQWTRNGTPIPGANGSSLTFGPVSPDDSTATFVCQIRALGYVDNSLNPTWLNSSAAHITVSGNTVYETNFVLHEYYGLNPPRNSIRDGTAGSPTWLMAEPAFEADINGTEVADNFSDELIGFFIPPATGDYVFFCNSDDGAELYLSTDNSALNRRLIAQETAYSGALQWGLSTGGGTVSQVRSDTFVDTTTGTTPYAAGIHLIQGQKYFMQIVHSQGTGGTESCVTANLLGDPTPAAGSLSTIRKGQISCYVPRCTYVTVTNQPQNLTTNAYSTATFTAGGATDSTVPVGNEHDWRTQFGNFLLYQWYKNGQPIAGATASQLTLPNVLPSDNGASIVAQVRALGYADGSGNPIWASSTAATLTVITGAPPNLVFAGVLSNYATVNFSQFGNQPTIFVGLTFDRPMDPVPLSNPLNYSFSAGSGITSANITAILVNSNSYRNVELALNAWPITPFTVTVNGVYALGGGLPLTGLSTTNVAEFPLTCVDVGQGDGTTISGWDPAIPSELFITGPNRYEVVCEGSDIWGTHDGCNFLYELKTNDFDVVVRQVSITKVSNWSKGGLMIRETLDPGSRDWNVINDPVNSDGTQAIDGSGTGANMVESNGRVDTGLGSAGWATAGGPPAYPNAWVRLSLRRIETPTTTNHIITSYSSTDGTNWVYLGSIDAATNSTGFSPLPDPVYVGICSTAHDNDGPADPLLRYANTAEYADYNSQFVGAKPTLMVQFIDSAHVRVSWAPLGEMLYVSPSVGPDANWQPVSRTSPVTVTITGNQAEYFSIRR